MLTETQLLLREVEEGNFQGLMLKTNNYFHNLENAFFIFPATAQNTSLPLNFEKHISISTSQCF